MSKVKSKPIPSNDREDSFMANLRQALEHAGDAEWLNDHSPLATSWVDSPQTPAQAHPPATGVKAFDDLLADIWQDWQTRSKTPLQALLWSAVQQVRNEKDLNVQALLMLTYFQDPRPKQADLIKLLAVGQSTFYRQLNTAVEVLERVVVSLLQPSLRLESIQAKRLIGRDDLIAACSSALDTGGLVHLIGPGGLGKTSVAAAVCQSWKNQRRPAFWYSIRPGLTDNPQHLIYALALFLHQCGESSLWLHLLSKPDEVSAAKAMAMIRKSLEKLAAPALFCFDDADLLLPDELNDTEPHQSLRALLEDFAESPRNGSPLLFIGQRLLMAPERGKVFQVDRFTTEHTRQMLTQAGFSLDGATIDAILHYTRGNPLLLHLLIVLQQLGESAMSQPALLSATASLDWFVARLLRHLSDREHEVMEAISAFDTPAPASLWRKQHKAVEHLSQLGLIERDTAGDLMLLPALREAIYRQLSAEARETHHLAAAQGCAELGAFTLAARHYVQGRRPEMAIWLWHAHRDEEIRQGQAQTALGLFLPLQVAPLSNEQDRRALALILADLNHLAGKHEAGLVALEATSWPAKGAQSAHAHALKAKLLAMQGDVERAVQSYRAGVRELEHALPAEPVTLRVEMARQMLTRMRDVAQSRQEALLAKHDVELLLGEIDEEAGNVDAAHSKYMTALEAARVSNDPVRLAKACEMLGILESRRQNVVAAQRYLAEAGEHYQAYGNIVCAAGMTKSNIAFAYMMAGQHDKAVVPLREAISFYEGMNQPYHLALNLANLSEVMIHLNDAEQAEQLAWRALSYEEAVVRPLCLYVLGEARRRQRQFQEAERMCKDAIDSADTNSDPWSAAYAWRVLGDVYRDWARPAEAQGAYTHARDLFEQFGLQEDAARMNAHMSTLSTAAGAST